MRVFQRPLNDTVRNILNLVPEQRTDKQLKYVSKICFAKSHHHRIAIDFIRHVFGKFFNFRCLYHVKNRSFAVSIVVFVTFVFADKNCQKISVV